MKYLFSFIVILQFLCRPVTAQDFITKWTFPAAATSITFNAQTAGGAVNYTWSAWPSGNSGSGSFTRATAGSVTISGLNIVANDVVTLNMEPARLRRFYANNTDKTKLTDVTQWGAVPWRSMQSAFEGCSNLDISATDVPNLSGVTSMAKMFSGCTILNGPVNIGSWNTSNVVNMSDLFFSAENFNQAIGNWDVSNVTTMLNMFMFARAFNQPIGGWNVSKVTNMMRIFNGTREFNQYIGNWNVSNVVNFWEAFASTKQYNQPLDHWNTSSATEMYSMFREALVFNQPVSHFDVSNVLNMRYMFWRAKSFNQPLGSWSTGNVLNMSYMFSQADAFNQNIGHLPLNSDVDLMGMLDENGMDYCNYSATLQGWLANNSTVTGRTLGALGRAYTSEVGLDERNTLVSVNNWTITGDSPISINPYLMPAGELSNGIVSCYEGAYFLPLNTTQKVLTIASNGNTFDFGTVQAVVSNRFVGSAPGGVVTGVSYYESSAGTNTLRVGRRLHSIQQAGTYAVNGGVIVRVYYDPAELVSIEDNSTLPSGSNPLVKKGWFKSSRHVDQDVVNDMTPATLTNAVELTPVATGTESGVSYAEFLLASFSTIGYYASTSEVALPVRLVSLQAISQESAVLISWATSSEDNSSHFEVERSADARVWKMIGKVGAKNSSSVRAEYSFPDTHPLRSNYYRLKMVDLDGSYAYSRIVSAVGDAQSLKVYPNPVKTELTVEGLLGGDQVELVDMSGRVLKRAVAEKSGSLKMDTGIMKNGLYLVRVREISGTQRAYKVVKE